MALAIQISRAIDDFAMAFYSHFSINCRRHPTLILYGQTNELVNTKSTGRKICLEDYKRTAGLFCRSKKGKGEFILWRRRSSGHERKNLGNKTR